MYRSYQDGSQSGRGGSGPWNMYPPPPPPPPPPRPKHKQHQQQPPAGPPIMPQGCAQAASMNGAAPERLHDGSVGGANSRRASVSSDGPLGLDRLPCEHSSEGSLNHHRTTQDHNMPPGMSEVIQRLEARLLSEICRVEMDAQSGYHTIMTDMGKWRKEREAAWKHVGELKEQNRLLRHRNYELEVQNGHLHRHIMMLQDQLDGKEDPDAPQTLPGEGCMSCQQPPPPLHGLPPPDPRDLIGDGGVAVVAAATGRHGSMPKGGAYPALHNQKQVPRLPHTGADIW